MDADFNGKVALVTGAAAGMGRAGATAFAAAGAAVILLDFDEAGGEQAEEELLEAGHTAKFFPCNVADESEVAAAIGAGVAEFGRLDAAFNNAGTEHEILGIEELSTDEFQRVLAVNLGGIWNCMKHELPHMVKQGSGAIVNSSSIAGLVGLQGMPAYTASKHGVVGLTKAVAIEYGPKNIRVNCICPGTVYTPMMDRFTGGGDPEAVEALVQMQPIGRIGEPAEIASAAVWLCGPGASFMVGAVVPVDGGWTIG